MNKILTLKMAWRYLVAKKSHSAVGAIAAVAIAGMAVATAAIICVLSVFNGFQDSIGNRLDRLSPDILVQPKKGKVFENADSLSKAISKLECVEYATPTLTDNALAIYQSFEMPVTLKGANLDDYRKIVELDSILISESEGQQFQAESYLSVGAASGLHTFPDENIMIFAPRRIGKVNLANPSSSFLVDSIVAGHIFRADQKEYDENYIITDLRTVADLLQYDSEASAIEIKLRKTSDQAETIKEIQNVAGDRFYVKDRLAQQEMNFKMIKIEKWITFLLLFLILIIASFNIISSLSMLVIEKRNSLSTLRALGMNRKHIGGIFFWESIYVTMIGGGIGIVIGLLLSYSQQYFGFIKIGGDPSIMVMDAYPVLVKLTDVLITLIPILFIGITTAWITSSYAKKISTH